MEDTLKSFLIMINDLSLADKIIFYNTFIILCLGRIDFSTHYILLKDLYDAIQYRNHYLKPDLPDGGYINIHERMN